MFKEFTKGSRVSWSIDHCHKTGKVRGLLCKTCNTGIGHLKDDPNILRSAINYLELDRTEIETTVKLHVVK